MHHEVCTRGTGKCLPTTIGGNPVCSIPSQQVPSPELSRADSSEGMGIQKADASQEETSQGVKRKKASDNDGTGTSKRRRHVITVYVSSDEDASPSIAAQETAETPSPN